MSHDNDKHYLDSARCVLGMERTRPFPGSPQVSASNPTTDNLAQDSAGHYSGAIALDPQGYADAIVATYVKPLQGPDDYHQDRYLMDALQCLAPHVSRHHLTLALKRAGYVRRGKRIDNHFCAVWVNADPTPEPATPIDLELLATARCEPYREPHPEFPNLWNGAFPSTCEFIAHTDTIVAMLEAYADELADGGRCPNGEWDPDCQALEDEWHKITAAANRYRQLRQRWEAPR